MAIENLNIPQAEVIEDHPDEDVSVSYTHLTLPTIA